jgi:P-type E1-E2 ATPase
VLAAWDGATRGAFAVTDTIKPSAAPAVARLRRLGLRPVLLTGDNAATARAVADTAGISEVISEALPAAKTRVIAGLQDEGRSVTMVGDGSTTVRRSRRPAWDWPSARAPTWPSPPPT